MIDRDKVIKGLTCCSNHTPGFGCSECPYECDDMDQCIEAVTYDALELLKKQEAVAPVLVSEGANKQHNNYKCPECNTLLYYEQKYCEWCGRKVEWVD